MENDKRKPFELFKGWTDEQKRAWMEKAAEDDPGFGIYAVSPEIYKEMMDAQDEVFDEKMKAFEQRMDEKVDEEEDEK